MVNIDHGIPLNNEKGWTIDIHNNLDEYPRNYAKSKEPVLKGYILYDSSMKYFEMTKF